MSRLARAALLAGVLAAAAAAAGGPLGCARERPEEEEAPSVVEISLRHGRRRAAVDVIGELLARFEAENPGVRVREKILPSTSDAQHQYFVTNFEGGSIDFDVLSMDVIWVPEFARAGWVRDLSDLAARARLDLSRFLEQPLAVDRVRGGVHGLPWYVDAGVLYYRADLLEKYGLEPPRSLEELVAQCRTILEGERDPRLHGFVWQGKQYEGLVCAALEFVHGNGGRVIGEDGRAALAQPEAIEAIAFLADLIHVHRVSPATVTTLDEEASRHLFGSGRAVFLRNWPYAWNLFQADGSAVAGRVGVVPIPGLRGGSAAAPTLGGWHLGVAAASRHPEEAFRLVEFLLRDDSQRRLCIGQGLRPSIRDLYFDRELLEAQPVTPIVFPAIESAVPRPITPFYLMISQVLQAEISAALVRVKTPAEAMQSASKQIDRILALEES